MLRRRRGLSGRLRGVLKALRCVVRRICAMSCGSVAARYTRGTTGRIPERCLPRAPARGPSFYLGHPGSLPVGVLVDQVGELVGDGLSSGVLVADCLSAVVDVDRHVHGL